MGKAMAAAKRIFKIMDYPTEINACAMDDDKTKIRLNID
jgi:hypothetical protein